MDNPKPSDPRRTSVLDWGGNSYGRSAIQGHAYSRNPSKRKMEEEENWKVVPPDWVICSTDAAIGSGHSVGSSVFRDSINRILDIAVSHLDVTDPYLEEATSLVSAADWAIKLGYRKVLFTCDNETVVHNLKRGKEECTDHRLEGISERFHFLSRRFERNEVKHIRRDQNILAHNTAKWSKHSGIVGKIVLGNIDEEVLSDAKEWAPKAWSNQS